MARTRKRNRSLPRCWISRKPGKRLTIFGPARHLSREICQRAETLRRVPYHPAKSTSSSEHGPRPSLAGHRGGWAGRFAHRAARARTSFDGFRSTGTEGDLRSLAWPAILRAGDLDKAEKMERLIAPLADTKSGEKTGIFAASARGDCTGSGTYRESDRTVHPLQFGVQHAFTRGSSCQRLSASWKN